MKIDVELLEFTKGQLDLNLKDLDNFKYERIENFRKFMGNVAFSSNDINTIIFAAHEYRQRVRFDLNRTPFGTAEYIYLQMKLEILDFYDESALQYKSLF